MHYAYCTCTCTCTVVVFNSSIQQQYNKQIYSNYYFVQHLNITNSFSTGFHRCYPMLGLVGGVKPRKLIENGPGSMQCILCTCRTRKSKNYFLKIIFSMRFSSIDSSTSYYGPVSTMTTTFFENSKINFTIQQINQLNYNFLSMDLSTSAHAMTSLLSS